MSELCLGDVISVKIPQENREWGYNPCPDRTKGEVIGFGSITYGRTQIYKNRPGKYKNRSWPKIKLETGEEITISCCHVNLVDDSGRKEDPMPFMATKEEKERDFIEPLPDLPFWEGDIVESDIWEREFGRTCFINGIDYGYIGHFCNDGVTPMPIYRVSPMGHGGMYCAVREEDITLIKRGNVWKHYHDEPLEFKDIREESSFFASIGQSHEVKNPACGLYMWTIEEALEALRRGDAHAISADRPLFAPSDEDVLPRLSVYVFDDADLGRRLAEVTLEGFKDFGGNNEN